MARLVAIALGVYSTLAVGGPPSLPDCTPGFSSLPEAADESERIVVKAYRELLDVLGKGELSPAELEKMAQTDPFVAPETGGRDLSTLNRKLSEFKEMLKTKGWDGPEAQQRLTAELGRLAREKSGAAETVERQAKVTASDLILEVGRMFPPARSPDGRWLVGQPSVAHPSQSNAGKLTIVDTAELKAHLVPGDPNLSATPLFSEDGRKLLFPISGLGAVEVPFRDGAPAWTEKRQALKPLANVVAKLRRLSPANVPGVYFTFADGGEVYRADLTSGETTTSVLPGIPPSGNSIWEWGGVPGQNRFYAVISNGSQYDLLMYRYDTKWKFEIENRARRLEKHPGKIRIVEGGKTLVTTGEGEDDKVRVGPVEGSTPLTAIVSSTGTNKFPGRILKVFPEVGDGQLLVVSVEKSPARTTLELVNLAKKQTVKSFTLPYAIKGETYVSGGGEVLLHPTSTDSELRVINLRERFGP